MRLYALIVFSIAVASASAKYDAGADSVECNCIALSKCKPLWSNLIVARSKSLVHHRIYTDHLKELNCGYETYMPKVCCPLQNDIPNSLNKSPPFLQESDKSINLKKPKCLHLLQKGSTAAPSTTDSSLATDTTKEHGSSTVSISSTTSFANHGKLEHEKYYAECGRDLNRDRHFGNRTELSDFPWLALLEYDTPKGKNFLCGGVLISDQYILTAAHCVTSRGNKLTKVWLGEHDVTAKIDCMADGNIENTTTCAEAAIPFGIDQTIVHSGYKDEVTHRDELYNSDNIALIRLKKRVRFSPYIQPICLPQRLPVWPNFIVSGWSRSFIPNNKGLDQKLMSKLTTVLGRSCHDHVLMPFVTKKHICAGIKYTDEQPCIADAGGPLMGYEFKHDGSVRLTVFGISYMDLACDRRDLPGVYTRVNDYVPWILKHIKNH